jgi:hypothetical protein
MKSNKTQRATIARGYEMTNSNRPPFALRLNLLFLAFYFVGFGCSFAIGTQFDYWGIAWLIMVLGSSPIIWLKSRKALRIKNKLDI